MCNTEYLNRFGAIYFYLFSSLFFCYCLQKCNVTVIGFVCVPFEWYTRIKSCPFSCISSLLLLARSALPGTVAHALLFYTAEMKSIRSA